MGCFFSSPVVEDKHEVRRRMQERDAASTDADAPSTQTMAPPKPQQVAPETPAPAQATPVVEDLPKGARRRVVYIVYYSMYGHVEKLVRRLEAGIRSTGMTVQCFQVEESLPEDVLQKMGAAPKAADHPVVDPDSVVEACGLVFAFPTRFGMMCAQMKAFFDATSGLWQGNELSGVPVTMVTSSDSQVGGQETTIMTAVTQLAHHGMIFVPIGYTAGTDMFDVGAVKGGGPWGAGTVARQGGAPTEKELSLAQHQGAYFAKIVDKLYEPKL